MTWRSSCWISMRAGPPIRAMPMHRPRTNMRHSPPPSPSRRRPIRRTPSTAYSPICSRHCPWTGWCAATSASARRRWPCGRPFWRSRTAGRLPYWSRPPCSRSSTIRTSVTASPTGRCASRRCRASAAANSRKRLWPGSRRARSTSSSARTSCCRSRSGSSASVCSSSTRNTVSGSPRRNG